MKARILFLFVLLTATQVSFSAPGNDDYASPTSINPGDTIFGDTTSATFDDVGFCGTSNTAPGVWYEVTGTGNGMIASTCDQADYDTKISVFDGSGVNPVCIGGNDDAAGCSGFTTEFTWPTTPGVPYKILVHGFASATGSFDLTLTEVISSGNDSYESPTPINIGETVSGSTTAATLDGVAFCGTSNTAPGVWYTVTGNGDTLTASTCNQANYDTKISIFDATGGGQVCVDGQDDAAGCAGFTTELSWPSVAGVPYNILVHGFGTATGDFDLTISGPDNEAPVAIAGVDQSIRAGDTVNLDGSGSFDDNNA